MQSSFLVAAWEVEEVAQPCGRHSAFNGKPLLRHVKVNSKYRTYLSAQIYPVLLRLSLVSGLNSGRTHWVARLSQLGDSINVGLPGARVAALVGRQRYCREYIWGGDAFVTINITFVTLNQTEGGSLIESVETELFKIYYLAFLLVGVWNTNPDTDQLKLIGSTGQTSHQ